MNSARHKLNLDRRAQILERLDRTLHELSMASRAGGQVGGPEVSTAPEPQAGSR